jgi:ABC-type phosphate/phosphonate transport system substrate-binding protein
VATPRYSAPGCEGATYRSAVVVRASDSAGSLADLEHRRCAVNQPDSNSGMNLLRAAIAPLAGGRRFFAGVALSGAHQRSAEMVAGGAADVAALDCVTWAHLGRLYPVLADQLRVLCWTPASASLPFITADSTSDAMLRTLRSVLEDVLADSSLAGVRERLLLTGIDPAPDSSFSGVLALERRAIESGYPTLE